MCVSEEGWGSKVRFERVGRRFWERVPEGKCGWNRDRDGDRDRK